MRKRHTAQCVYSERRTAGKWKEQEREKEPERAGEGEGEGEGEAERVRETGAEAWAQ